MATRPRKQAIEMSSNTPPSADVLSMASTPVSPDGSASAAADAAAAALVAYIGISRNDADHYLFNLKAVAAAAAWDGNNPLVGTATTRYFQKKKNVTAVPFVVLSVTRRRAAAEEKHEKKTVSPAHGFFSARPLLLLLFVVLLRCTCSL